MQPGMPQAFGTIEGKPYFGLPGNPVSVFVSFEVFVRPALMKLLGRAELQRPEVTATLTTGISGPKDRLQFARVMVRRRADEWIAVSTGAASSNLISTVARANGLAMIPSGQETATAGSRVRVMLFRALER
jgi:molybdopterin molybdotransferase